MPNPDLTLTKVLRKYYVRDVPDYEPTLVWSGDETSNPNANPNPNPNPDPNPNPKQVGR